MGMNCPGCKFAIDPDQIVNGECPNCGTSVRDHMNVPGSSPPGDLRDMVDPGYGQDMGGNPLGEGILGDWKPDSVRDEAFASVQANDDQELLRQTIERYPEYHITGIIGRGRGEDPGVRTFWVGDDIERGRSIIQLPVTPLNSVSRNVTSMAHTFQVDMTDPSALIHGGNQAILGLFGAKVNGIPAGEDLMRQGFGYSPVDEQGNPTKPENLQPVNVEIEHPEHEEPVRAAIDQGRHIMMKKLGPAAERILPHLQAIKEGTSPRPSHWDQPQEAAPQQQPAIASLHAGMEHERVAWYDEMQPHIVEPWGKEAKPLVDVGGWVEDHAPGVNDVLNWSPNVNLPGGNLNDVGVGDIGQAGLAVGGGLGVGAAKGLIGGLTKGAVGNGVAGASRLPGALKGLGAKGLKALPNIAKWHAIGQIGQAALGGGGAAPGGAVPGIVQPQTYQQLSSIHSELTADTSDLSVPSIGEGVEPDRVDPHESPANTNFYDPEVDTATGGYDTGLAYPDNPEIEEAFFDALPDLSDYFEREQSGLENPKIRRLHELLEANDPDYVNYDQDIDKHFAKVALGPVTPMPQTGPIPGQPGVAQSPTPTAQPAQPGQCPPGHVFDPERGQCMPGPGLTTAPAPAAPIGPVGQQPGYMASIKEAIHDHQGPANNEQFAAVAELLEAQGRQEEIITMLSKPWDYAEELAVVQQNPNKPPIDQSQPQQATPEQLPPPAPTPGAPGMGGPPGGMMPGVPPGMVAALQHVGADGAAPRCPECGSATTGIDNIEGNDKVEAHCHSCGNQWTPAGLKAIKETKTAFEDYNYKYNEQGGYIPPTHAGDPQPTEGIPLDQHSIAANERFRELIAEGIDSNIAWQQAVRETQHLSPYTADDHDGPPSHEDLHVDSDETVDLDKPLGDEEKANPPERTWADKQGDPLRVGMTYEMHSANYAIPDVVRVEAIKPDAIDLLFVGEYTAHDSQENQLSYRHEIPKEEAELEQLTFEATDAVPPEDRPEEQQAVHHDYGPGDSTDLSTPHVNLTHALAKATTPEEVQEVLALYEGDPENLMMPNRQKLLERRDQAQRNLSPKGISDTEEGLLRGRDTDFSGFSGQGWSGAGPGRGLIDTQGNVHHWNEEEGDHQRYMDTHGVQGQKFFGIGADGSVIPYDIGNVPFDDSDYQLLANAHPRIKGPAVEQDDELYGFSKVHGETPEFERNSHNQEDVDPELEWLRSNSVEEAEVPEGENIDPDLAWLAAEGGFDPRTAGKKFTPPQQRKFIDEEGTARNADKLNLTGTHYEARDQGNGLNVEEDDFCLGLL